MMIKTLVLANNDVLISQLEEVDAEIGDPNCKLTDPFLVKRQSNDELYLESFLIGLTDQNTIMINSDKILTIVEPSKFLLEKYIQISK